MVDPSPSSVPGAADDATAIEALRVENERLRRLVGPLEQSYVDLRRELDQASAAVRAAEAANGELRGEIQELTVALGQARHNMGKVSRIVYQRTRRIGGRLTRPLRRWFNDHVGPAAATLRSHRPDGDVGPDGALDPGSTDDTPSSSDAPS